MNFLFFIAVVWGSAPGCNDVKNENGNDGPSKCFQQWEKRQNPKEALKCCMSYREGDHSEFNVPIIVLPYEHQGRASRYRSRQNINMPRNPQCYPKSKDLKDIDGFFNFLDLYLTVPFNDFPDSKKSSNWNCFNTVDNYDGVQILNPPDTTRKSKFISKHGREMKKLKKRTRNNFCRTLLYEYHLSYTPKEFREDVCDGSGHNIFPLQQSSKRVRLTEFKYNQNNRRNVNNKFMSPIYMSPTERTKKVDIFLENQSKKTVTVFEDFYDAWHDMAVQFPENYQYERKYNHHKHNEVHTPVLMEFNCGCFV